jgi:hypothetical protein
MGFLSVGCSAALLFELIWGPRAFPGPHGVGLSSFGARGRPRVKPGGLNTTPHDRISYRGVSGRTGFSINLGPPDFSGAAGSLVDIPGVGGCRWGLSEPILPWSCLGNCWPSFGPGLQFRCLLYHTVYCILCIAYCVLCTGYTVYEVWLFMSVGHRTPQHPPTPVKHDGLAES